MSFEEKQLKVGGIEINFRQVGKKSNPHHILVLHGWNQRGSESWEEFLSLFNEKEFFVIAPDLPGFGKTTPPEEIWKAKEYAEFVSSFVEKSGLKQSLVVGHSFGGATAGFLAINHPKQVQNLALCAPAIVRDVQDHEKKIIEKISKTFGFLKKIPGLRKIWYRIIGSPDYDKTKGIMQNIFREVIKEDLQHILPRIKQNTLLIWGSKDKYTPIAQARVVKDGIKNSEILVFDEVNHGIHIHKPKKLFEAINTIFYE